MKMTLATIFLVLAASQANADGFYQQIIGNSPQSEQAMGNAQTEFTYTPLYRQVTENKMDFSHQVVGGLTEFSYTPLYLKVTGKDLNRTDNIASRNPAEGDSNI
jgi:hypothetical protein